MRLPKNDYEFTIKHRMPASLRDLFYYIRTILAKGSKFEAAEVEFVQDKFHKYTKSIGGKPYHRTTIVKSMEVLAEMSEGLIVIQRDYGYGTYKLLVRPISFLKEKKSSKAGENTNEKRGNPMFSDEQKKRIALQQQQDINKIQRLTENIGLRFDSDALTRIWKLSGKCVDMVVKAIKLLLYRHSNGHEEIKNPHGFIINCLKRGWAKDLDLYYQPELPTFNNRMVIDTFIDNLVKKNGASDEIAPTPT